MKTNSENAIKDLAIVRSLGCQYLGQSDHCCGSRDLVDNTVYCKEHWPGMFQKGTALRKRKKDKRVAEQVWDLQSLFNEAVRELEAEGLI